MPSKDLGSRPPQQLRVIIILNGLGSYVCLTSVECSSALISVVYAKTLHVQHVYS